MRDSIFLLSFSLRRQSKGRTRRAASAAENQNLFPRLRLLLPAVPLSVAIAKIYIRIFGPRDRVHCLEVVIRRARACEHNTGSLVLNRIDLYLLMIILISGAQIPRFNYSSLQCDVARVTTRQKLASLFSRRSRQGQIARKHQMSFCIHFPFPSPHTKAGTAGAGLYFAVTVHGVHA